MANGVPVVVPRRGAFPEILEKTGGGILVEPDDPASLADGIFSLWKDRELLAELGRRAALGVREHYTAAQMAAGPSRSTARSPMLEISHLAKEYPTPRGPLPVLSDITLSLQRGQAAAIMGPSGAGKSTLLYILGALEPPTSGLVTLDGRNPTSSPKRSSPPSATRPSGSSFRTTACCRNAPCSKTC